MDTELVEHPDSLPTAPVAIPAGHALVRLITLTKDEQKAIPADAKIYSKPNCRHCHGKGFLGMTQASIRRIDGRVEVVKPHRAWCRCISVILPTPK